MTKYAIVCCGLSIISQRYNYIYKIKDTVTTIWTNTTEKGTCLTCRMLSNEMRRRFLFIFLDYLSYDIVSHIVSDIVSDTVSDTVPDIVPDIVTCPPKTIHMRIITPRQHALLSILWWTSCYPQSRKMSLEPSTYYHCEHEYCRCHGCHSREA